MPCYYGKEDWIVQVVKIKQMGLFLVGWFVCQTNTPGKILLQLKSMGLFTEVKQAAIVLVKTNFLLKA